jgi:hypothetical protein
MNPTVPRDGEFITEAYADDPVAAAAEFGAEFRRDIEGFVSREAIEACVDQGVFERGRVSSVRYYGFVDPSGGASDAMTCAIAHKEGDRAVLDVVREFKPPFSPETVVADMAMLFKAYGIARVTGDRYAGEFVREPFQKAGVKYEPSAKPKSDLYRDLLPALNSRRVALLDHEKLTNQLVSLERRTGRGTGRDVIDHTPGAHDDVANAVAGVVSLAIGGMGSTYTLANISGPDDPKQPNYATRRLYAAMRGPFGAW